MDNLFNNIGGKIKKLAKVIFVIELIAFFFLAISSFIGSGEYEYGESSDYLFAVGLVYLLVGPIISWLSSCLIYGFGELIDKTSDNNRQLRLLRNPNETINNTVSPDNTPIISTASVPTSPEKSSTIGKCDNCSLQNVEVTECKIVDSYGTRYRKLCNDCKEKEQNNDRAKNVKSSTSPCPHCGRTILANAQFCPFCGGKCAEQK